MNGNIIEIVDNSQNMLGQSIFESQFAVSGMTGFGSRYPSYANYKSETLNIGKSNSTTNPIDFRDFDLGGTMGSQKMMQHHSDDKIIPKPDLSVTPGYYSQTSSDLRPRPTEFGVRPQIETEEARRQTVGGSPLEGLIAQFRNNSLGADLRKLKEAHQQIIEELKQAVFRKKSKKKADRNSSQAKPNIEKKLPSEVQRSPGRSKQQQVRPQHQQNNAAVRVQPSRTVQEHKQNPRRIENRQEKVAERSHPLLPTQPKQYTQPTQPTRATHKQNTKNQDHGINRFKSTTVMEVREPKSQHENVMPRPHQNQPIKPKQHATDLSELSDILREEFEQEGFDNLNPRVIDEILGLREVKISLMKQLNQQTSNYNRVMMENRQIVSENRQLKEQINSKHNAENIPLVQKLNRENARLREKMSKLQQQLKNFSNGIHDVNGKTSTSLSEQEVKVESAKVLKLGRASDSDNRETISEQLSQEQSRNEKLLQELQMYKERYGEITTLKVLSPKQRERQNRMANW